MQLDIYFINYNNFKWWNARGDNGDKDVLV